MNKTAVPPCADDPSKKVFEQAITGALCKFVKLKYSFAMMVIVIIVIYSTFR